MNKKELRLYLAIAKAEEAEINRRLSQYRGTIGGARNLLRMSAYKGIVRVLLELELAKYADIRVPKFEAGKVPSGRNIYVSVADEYHALMTRNRLRGDVIV